MDATEKAKQIDKETGDSSATVKADDIDIMFPEPSIFQVSDRYYQIYPLPIKKQRLLMRMSNLEETEEGLDELTQIVSELIGEKEKEFIEGNFSSIDFIRLRMCIEEVNNRGLEGLLQQSKKKQVKSET